jgi:crossover junction endodeoxyribonuclease RuvC
MRVLGVDPGLTRCGVGVVEGMPGKPLTMVHVGVIRTEPDDEIGVRLVALERGLEAVLEEFRPDAVAVERVFAQHNVRTVMGTAQAGAVAIVGAARRGLPVALHTPSEAKAAVTGNGRADKAQVTMMVTRLLRLESAPEPADAADALALAICHLWRGAAQARLAAAGAGEDRFAAAVARAKAAAKTPTRAQAQLAAARAAARAARAAAEVTGRGSRKTTRRALPEARGRTEL